MKKIILNIALLTVTTLLINSTAFAQTTKTKSVSKADTTKTNEKKSAEIKNDSNKSKSAKESNIYRMENPYKYFAKRIQVA